ncbi:hypothetical protein MMC10_002024 [Thelotrema lepadinum]|nr:hypothetical protein [Thelotrema lepadinum]
MTIALAQADINLGAHYLEDISNPKSANFGKHWTSQQVKDAFAPSDTTSSAVQTWLTDAGISKDSLTTSTSGGYVKFDATVKQIESLLNTNYHVYKHLDSGKEHIGCDNFQLPSSLKAHIDFIKPTISFPRSFSKHTGAKSTVVKSKALQNRAIDPSCTSNVTPDCIKSLYNIPSNTTAHTGNNIGIVEFGETYDQEDLDQFYSEYAKNIPAGTGPTNDLIDGATAPVKQGSQGTETMLDLDIAFPIVYPQGVTLIQTKGNTGADGDLILDSIDASYCQPSSFDNCTTHFDATNVLSISYGSQEDGSADQARECQEFMKLGLQGISVIVSSGDGGVGGPRGTCPANGFFVDYWASCPYVTAVGATQLTSDGTEVAAQVASENFSSGGGFSNVFPRPDYQNTAVSGYVSKFLASNSTSSQFNISGRSYPDLSAVGNTIDIVVSGKNELEGGTSASAPLIASIITLINGERIAAGKGPIGFLNPTLYQNPSAFNDITSGSNPGCGSKGFSAEQGWDPVTGLGSPDYQKLASVFNALP